MKEKIFALIFALLSISSIYALVTPQPISGSITTIPASAVEGLTIIGRNLRTMDEIMGTRAGNQYLLEMANSPREYAFGDVVRVIIAECANEPACNQEVAIYGEPIVLDFDLTQVELPCVCPVCPTCPTTTTVPSCIEQGYILPEDCEEIICPECPMLTFEAQVTIAITVMVTLVLSFGGGIKFYKKKTGEAALLHRHIGIRAYHDPNILHRNPKYRHKKGELAPKLPIGE